MDENLRCRQVGIMLKRNATDVGGSKKGRKGTELKMLEAGAGVGIDEVSRWYEDYCGSCRKEEEELREGRGFLGFG